MRHLALALSLLLSGPTLADAATLRGEVVQPYACRFADDPTAPGAPTMLVRHGTRLRPVYADARLAVGDTVKVRGRRDRQKILIPDTVTTLSAATVGAVPVFATERVVVIPLEFQEARAERDHAALVEAWEELRTFVANASAGRTTVDVRVLPWQRSPRARPDLCDMASLMREAVRLADPVVDFRTVTRVAVVWPLSAAFPAFECPTSYRGMGAYVTALATAEGDVVVGQMTTHEYEAASTHEFGHTLGFHHGNALDCDAPGISEGTLADCVSTEYGDILDPMGGGVGDWSATFKQQAQWLDPLRVDAPGEYRLAPLGGATGTRALRLPGTRALLLENRWPVGNDAPLDYVHISGGVTFHTRVAPLLGQHENDSQLVWTAHTGKRSDAFLQVGRALRIGPRWEVLPLAREADGTLRIRVTDLGAPTPIATPTRTPVLAAETDHASAGTPAAVPTVTPTETPNRTQGSL